MSPVLLAFSALPPADPCRVEAWAGSKTYRPGNPVTVAVRLTPDKGWHTYWVNPGDSGSPPALDWKLPRGWSAAAVRFPVPKRIPTGEGLFSFGYEAPNVLLQRLTPPVTAGKEPSELTVTVSWVACREECVAGSSTLKITLRPGGGERDPVASEVIEAAEKRMPSALPKIGLRSFRSGGRIRLDVTGPVPWTADVARSYFFPADKDALDHSDGQGVAVSGRLLSLTLKPSTFGSAPPHRLRGVLAVPDSYLFLKKTPGLVIDVPIEASKLTEVSR
ncbi:MAG: hypothetical protein JST30_02315 [Armatimonadetes bacterium]|nr:hypothetical protein [Armatimonadota bacterium]